MNFGTTQYFDYPQPLPPTTSVHVSVVGPANQLEWWGWFDSSALLCSCVRGNVGDWLDPSNVGMDQWIG